MQFTCYATSAAVCSNEEGGEDLTFNTTEGALAYVGVLRLQGHDVEILDFVSTTSPIPGVNDAVGVCQGWEKRTE